MDAHAVFILGNYLCPGVRNCMLSVYAKERENMVWMRAEMQCCVHLQEVLVRIRAGEVEEWCAQGPASG
jgi:hypothetical protein